MSVLLANATRHHSFQTALALHRSGRLDRFITGIYAKRGSLRAGALRGLTSVASAGERSRVDNRRIDGLPDAKVRSIFWPDVTEQLLHRTACRWTPLAPETVTFLRNEVFDRQVAALHIGEPRLFHGFEQCAEFSLRRARSRGAINVLDMPIIFRGLWDRLEADERSAVGLPTPKRPAGFQHHIDRKYREIELADYFLTGLEYVRRSYVDSGIPEERVFLVPYGVDADARFRPMERPERREKLHILFVGQVSWYKGLRFLLDAFERLEIPARLSVQGLIHEEWKPYFARRFADLEGRDFHHSERIPSERMAALYADADVFVFPSLGGGIGLATFEAMATALPVITSDGDVVIRDGIDGLVRDPADVDAWVEALTGLWEDPARRLALGKAAAERVQAFTWDRYHAGIGEAYDAIEAREGLSV